MIRVFNRIFYVFRGGAFKCFKWQEYLLTSLTNMLYLLVQVNENVKCIVPEHVVSIEFTNNQFSDLFGAVTSGEYGDREVEVFIRREKSESWKKVDNGLKGNLEMLEVLKYFQVKFCLIEKINLDTPQTTNTLNAFDILMNNSYQLNTMVVINFIMKLLIYFIIKMLAGQVMCMIRLVKHL